MKNQTCTLDGRSKLVRRRHLLTKAIKALEALVEDIEPDNIEAISSKEVGLVNNATNTIVALRCEWVRMRELIRIQYPDKKILTDLEANEAIDKLREERKTLGKACLRIENTIDLLKTDGEDELARELVTPLVVIKDAFHQKQKMIKRLKEKSSGENTDVNLSTDESVTISIN